MIRVVHPGSRIRILTFYPSWIQDPGVKKAPDPGSGSATLLSSSFRWECVLLMAIFKMYLTHCSAKCSAEECSPCLLLKAVLRKIP